MSENAFMQDTKAATGAIALADGTVYIGAGTGFSGISAGELCFNTAMTGYQEILTDPSYSQQIVMFTFPHLGNVGANCEDLEYSSEPAEKAALGTIFREPVSPPANWRSQQNFSHWLEKRGIIGLSGVDTRALTRRIREAGMARSAITHSPEGNIDFEALIETARAWNGIKGADLAANVDTQAAFANTQGLWQPGTGFAEPASFRYKAVVLDFGVKRNILRNLASAGIEAIIVASGTSIEEVMALEPDGVVLSNGPGDPAATYERAGATIRALIARDIPLLGICLGHQLLALALGARTVKMTQGHHGANHPVRDMATGKIEIVSMNHGFTVDPSTLPEGVEESHQSLFDGTNSGLKVTGKPVISVQHHPEASPGPQDSFYIFRQFAALMEDAA